MSIDLRIKALSPKIGTELPVPSYATAGSAGMDLRACLDEPLTLNPGDRVGVPTGFAIALPGPEWVAYIFARSGLGIKNGITLPNCVGVIDSDYRGELILALTNLSDTPYTVQPGDRVAQLVISPVIQANISVVDELDETERGAGGFGSTGKR